MRDSEIYNLLLLITVIVSQVLGLYIGFAVLSILNFIVKLRFEYLQVRWKQLLCIIKKKTVVKKKDKKVIIWDRTQRNAGEEERRIVQSRSFNILFLKSLVEIINGLKPIPLNEYEKYNYKVKIDSNFIKVKKKKYKKRIFWLKSKFLKEMGEYDYFPVMGKYSWEVFRRKILHLKFKDTYYSFYYTTKYYLKKYKKSRINMKGLVKIRRSNNLYKKKEIIYIDDSENVNERLKTMEIFKQNQEGAIIRRNEAKQRERDKVERARLFSVWPDPLYGAHWIENVYKLRESRVDRLERDLIQKDVQFWQNKAEVLQKELVDKIRKEQEHVEIVKRLGGEPIAAEIIDKIFDLEGYYSDITIVRVRIRDMRPLIKKRMLKERDEAEKYDYGIILKLKDGIATIKGLKRTKSGEVLYLFNQFDEKNQKEKKTFIKGLVLNLNLNDVEVIVLGNDNLLKEGNMVFRSFNLFEVSTTLKMFGNVVDALGRSKKTGMSFGSSVERMGLVEKKAAGIIDRVPVNIPLRTGLKSVDSLVPIGRGQRELIIGDRQTGKTSVCIDTILNHAKINNEIKAFVKKKKCSLNDLRNIVWFIYAAVAQKQSSVSEISKRLEKNKAGWYTAIVSSTAADPAPLQFLVPYTACTLGEYIRDFVGGHCTVIYDDLSKHAVAYRQMSLLLRRPPGREAFPGDVFYIHSRLLERAGALRDMTYIKIIKFSRTPFYILTGKRMNYWKLPVMYPRGTLTALPVIETQAGDVSAYIPTNVISITDGQIFLETELFYKGIRPAINVGLSVSRVGSAAQPFIMKKVSGSLKMELAQYREVESFAKLSSNLDSHTQRILMRGENLIEILKQNLNKPLSTMKQVLSIFLGLGFNSGWLSDIVANMKNNVRCYVSLKRLTMSWFELFRLSSTQFGIKDINIFLSSFLKFYEVVGLSKVLELSANEELNGLILKKYSNYIFDDLVYVFLIESSKFGKKEFLPKYYLNKLKVKYLPKIYKKKEIKSIVPKLKLTKLVFPTKFLKFGREIKGETNTRGLQSKNGMSLFFQLPISMKYFKRNKILAKKIFKETLRIPFLGKYFTKKSIRYSKVMKCFMFLLTNLICLKMNPQIKNREKEGLSRGARKQIKEFLSKELNSEFVNLVTIISELINPFCVKSQKKMSNLKKIKVNKAIQYRLNNFTKFVSQKTVALEYYKKFKIYTDLNFSQFLLFLRIKTFTGEKGLLNLIRKAKGKLKKSDIFKLQIKLTVTKDEVVAANVKETKDTALQLNFSPLGFLRNELIQFVSFNLVLNKLLRIKKNLIDRLEFGKVDEENILAFDAMRMVLRRSFIYLLPRWKKLQFKNLQFKKIIKSLRQADLKVFTVFYEKLDDSSLKILNKYGIWFMYVYNFAIQRKIKWLINQFQKVIEKVFIVSSDIVDFKLCASRIINKYGKELKY